MKMQKQGPTPFIKWVGGKRQLLTELEKYYPQDFHRYFEPFIGGGANLLNFLPKRAVINDFNEELVNAWQVVKEQPEELINLIENHASNDSKEYYLDVRLADRDGRLARMSLVERAARFIYLNKAGFNGLWRVNSKGQNNVPYGAHKTVNVPVDAIRSDHHYLASNDVKILQGDYQAAVAGAKENDFVYFDPPYIPVNQTAAFTSYTKNGFGLAQQEELRDLALKLANRGVKVMLSNSDVPLIEQLYSERQFHIHHVQARRSVNSKGNKRGKVGEVIITTYGEES
ncbi:DNA adenine methylase [Limosilactobacillus fastidiosus]|nr:DNA adenine methylase [Limosilactobacillus fastidiosus]